MHLQNSLNQTKIQSRIVNFRPEVCAKARNKRKRANISHTERKTEEWKQRKTIGSCSRRDACSFLLMHVTGDGEDNVEWSGDTQENVTQSKHSLQYRKWKIQTDEEAWTVWRPVLRLKLKIPCQLRARWKISSCDYRHHPVCRGYKSGNRCKHGYRCLCRQADGKSNLSARSRRRYSWNSCYSEKKGPRLCISQLRSNEFYSTDS